MRKAVGTIGQLSWRQLSTRLAIGLYIYISRLYTPPNVDFLFKADASKLKKFDRKLIWNPSVRHMTAKGDVSACSNLPNVPPMV
jgi:hypothetical protein